MKSVVNHELRKAEVSMTLPGLNSLTQGYVSQFDFLLLFLFTYCL